MSEHTAEVPQSPTDLPGSSWWAAVRRSVGEFRRDNVTDWAAALTYYSVLSVFPAPNAEREFRWVTPGGVLAVLIWLVASAGFAFYVANFNSYNKTYGSLAALIIFLVWVWISNIAILFGAELNAELERGRAIAAGRPKTAEPYVELRDTSALDDSPEAKD